MLGHVAAASCWPDGSLREIRVRQADGHSWLVEAEHIRNVSTEVQLKGPREGFHIAPMSPSRSRSASSRSSSSRPASRRGRIEPAAAAGAQTVEPRQTAGVTP